MAPFAERAERLLAELAAAPVDPAPLEPVRAG
jgi:hypothetical protein